MLSVVEGMSMRQFGAMACQERAPNLSVRRSVVANGHHRRLAPMSC